LHAVDPDIPGRFDIIGATASDPASFAGCMVSNSLRIPLTDCRSGKMVTMLQTGSAQSGRAIPAPTRVSEHFAAKWTRFAARHATM
jgi:hypothetical protein